MRGVQISEDSVHAYRTVPCSSHRGQTAVQRCQDFQKIICPASSPEHCLASWRSSSTTVAVLGVATVAAVASYEHAYDLVRMHVSQVGLPF
jgi:hypothetical protein